MKMVISISDLFNINTIHNVKCSIYILKILASREYYFFLTKLGKLKK